MNENTKTPYEWYSVLNWTASLFLWGLVTNSAISKSPGGRIVFGLTWAIIGLIAVGIFKYFKRSKIESKEQLKIDSEKADKTVFYVCMVLGAMFIGQAFLVKSFGPLGDAAIYIALGFWVKSRSPIARWLLAVYAFVSTIFVATQGLSPGGMAPFIFFIIGLSIIINRKYELSEQVADPLIPPKSYTSAEYKTNSFNSHSPSSDYVAIDDDDRFFTQVAKELVSKQIDEGLWAKAFALQDGDEKKTKAQYIKLRVGQLARDVVAAKPPMNTEYPAPRKNNQITEMNLAKVATAIIGSIVAIGVIYTVIAPSKKIEHRLMSDAEVGITSQHTLPPTETNPSRKPFDPFASENLKPYEQRAWSGNMFDQFDPVDKITQKALAHDSRLNERRAWDAVLAWQKANIKYWKWDASVALYAAVDTVLEGFKQNKGVCRPGAVIVNDQAHASKSLPAGSIFIVDDCDR